MTDSVKIAELAIAIAINKDIGRSHTSVKNSRLSMPSDRIKDLVQAKYSDALIETCQALVIW